MKKTFIGYAMLVLPFALVACGDDSSSSSAPQQNSTATVESFASLPDCTKDIEGEVINVTEDNTSFICKDGKWVEDDGEAAAGVETIASSESKTPSSDSKETSSETPKCGEATYDPETQVCEEGKVLGKCGETTYDLEKYTCEEGKVMATCKDAKYDIATQACVKDVVYDVATIGEQVWMSKNMNVETEGSACYDDDPANCEKYGRLYTHEAATKVCPTGWHLPTEDDYDYFSEYLLDDNSNDMDKITAALKSSAVDWGEIKGTDKYGFAALPAGYFYQVYGDMGIATLFWTNYLYSSEENGTKYAVALYIDEDDLSAAPFDPSKNIKLSVRCVMDTEE